MSLSSSSPFFFNDPPTTEIYTLSLHDALPIFRGNGAMPLAGEALDLRAGLPGVEGSLQALHLLGLRLLHRLGHPDRKSTRLNSSHLGISYAVFCLKKKKKYSHLIHTTKQRHTI